MGTSVISGIIGGIIAVAICTYVSKKAKSTAVKGQLRHGRVMVVLGCACLVFVGFAILAFFYDNDVWEKRSELLSVIGLLVFFSLGVVFSFGEYLKVRGKFDEGGILFYTPWTGLKEEKWSDLESATFSQSANWYVLKFKSGKTIRVSNMLKGHGDLVELLEQMGHEF